MHKPTGVTYKNGQNDEYQFPMFQHSSSVDIDVFFFNWVQNESFAELSHIASDFPLVILNLCSFIS